MCAMKRRGFLKLTAGTLAAGGVYAVEVGGFSAFERVKLGKTGLETTRLCMGTGVKGFNRTSAQTKLGHDVFVKLLREAYERGIRCFDAADLYGSHGPLAEALKPFPRDSYMLISKVWWRKNGLPESERPATDVVIERFLKELGTDYIDLVQIHCVDTTAWYGELADRVGGLQACKQSGKIRAHGVSVHGFKGYEPCLKESWVDAVHVRLNPFGASMNGTVEDTLAVVRTLHGQGKGVIGMKILGEGKFAGDSEKVNQSLAFALNSGVVDVLNIGFLDVGQIDDIVTRIAAVKKV